MRGKFLLIVVFLWSAFLFTGCYDVIEKELDDQKINLLAPYEGAIIQDPLVTFWWSNVEYIDGYRLQVVKPSFANIENVVLDSIVTQENFTYEMPVGKFEWRVVAFNGGYELISDTLKLQVVDDESQIDLSTQSIDLFAPYNGAVLKEANVMFWWSKVNSVDGYRLQVVQPSFKQIEKIVLDTVTVNDRLSYNLLNGKYEWRVVAFNNVSELVSDSVKVEIMTQP